MTTIGGPYKLSMLQGILWGMHCSGSQEVTAPQNALRGCSEGLHYMKVFFGWCPLWMQMCAGGMALMERELKEVPRRRPIVWGNMTGALSSDSLWKSPKQRNF